MSRYIDADALAQQVCVKLCTASNCSNVLKIIHDMPTADVVEGKRGEWMYLYEDNYKCSICGSWWCCTDSQIGEMCYCPNCGADMRKILPKD